jgi:hypothetical protein
MKDELGISSSAITLVPRLYSLVSYPLFFCSTRVSVHKQLLQTPHGSGSLRYYSAMFRHGRFLYNKYGIFALYRGADIFLLQHLLRAESRKFFRNQKTRKSQVLARLGVEAALYPLALAGARVVASSLGDARDANLLSVWEDTWTFDGMSGLFAGLVPYLLALSVEESGELVLRRLRGNFPEMDAADETVAKISVLAATAVISAPLLQISLGLRTHSDIPYLPATRGISDQLANVDWRVFAFQTCAVGLLCALNFFLISDKHAPCNDVDVDD